MGILRDALEVYGKDAQVLMAIEEMAELQNELCKENRGRSTKESIAEEVADVEIMLEQMKILFEIEGAVKNLKDYKIIRLQGRIADKAKRRK